MSKVKPISGVKRYDGPAGGWGALKRRRRRCASRWMSSRRRCCSTAPTSPTVSIARLRLAGQGAHVHLPVLRERRQGGHLGSDEQARRRRISSPSTPSPSSRPGATTTSRTHGRLTHPLVYDRASDRYVPIAWDEAFARIGAVLRALPDPNAADFYTSGRASQRGRFLYQLFAREFGTNNFPDCSNMCHEATSVGAAEIDRHRQGHGVARGFRPRRPDLLDRPQSRHQPSAHDGHAARRARAAARRSSSSIRLRERALERFADPQNPSRWSTFGSTPIASTYLSGEGRRRRRGAEGLMKARARRSTTPARAARVLDRAFIAEHTRGFEAFAADLRATAWADIDAASGLTRERAGSGRGGLCAGRRRRSSPMAWASPSTTRAPATVQQIANLLLLRGNFGRPGAGICPLRGHSNVQGNRTVGITEKPTPTLIQGIERAFGFTPPAEHGHDAVAAMRAIARGPVEGADVPGRQFRGRDAGPERMLCGDARARPRRAYRAPSSTVRTSCRRREAILLPCLGRTERDVQAGGAQIGHGRGFDVDGPRLARQAAARLAASALGARDRRGHRRRDPAAQQGRVDGLDRRLRPHPRQDRDRLSRISETTTSASGSPAVSACRCGPTERIWNTPSGKAEFLPFHGRGRGLRASPSRTSCN